MRSVVRGPQFENESRSLLRGWASLLGGVGISVGELLLHLRLPFRD